MRNNVAIILSPVINGFRIRFRVALQSYLLALHSANKLIWNRDHRRNCKRKFPHWVTIFIVCGLWSIGRSLTFFSLQLWSKLTMNNQHDSFAHRGWNTIWCNTQIWAHMQSIHFAYVKGGSIDTGNYNKKIYYCFWCLAKWKFW